jgi:hypothetical protein
LEEIIWRRDGEMRHYWGVNRKKVCYIDMYEDSTMEASEYCLQKVGYGAINII